VHISNKTGVLQPSGTLHWVVVKNVNLERYKMGTVEVYNPFMDRNEIYSYREFAASAWAPFGVVKVNRPV
jgi:hypothetical protein